MVSYLAEQAAAEVNANAMVCRIGALYHDIGKIVKIGFSPRTREAARTCMTTRTRQ
ncbi:MAG: HDIG domain-containing metalloprotein [Bacilli bacterium]